MKYLNTPLNRSTVELTYSSNNVVYEKCELYRDYILSLFELVFITYLGDDVMNKSNQKEHFDWCWEQNISAFKKEGIIIDSIKLKDYFSELLLDVFYENKKKNDELEYRIIVLYRRLFDYNLPKTKVDMDSFIELYLLIDSSIKLI